MAPAAILQLIGQPAATDVARVMACLFELVRTDTFKQAHDSKVPRLVKMKARSFMNPYIGPRGHVTLKHGDTALTGSY
ncbi:hypothetical protein EJB05_23535, partial [Eragrostis curvula]